jgi:hypothetical protein
MINQQRLKKLFYLKKKKGGLNLTSIKINAKSVKFQWIYQLYNEDYNAFRKHLIWAVVHDYKIRLYGRVI